MATKKAGSRLETEIERCRSECQWERIPELVKQLSAKLIANGAGPGGGGRAGPGGAGRQAAAEGPRRGRRRRVRQVQPAWGLRVPGSGGARGRRRVLREPPSTVGRAGGVAIRFPAAGSALGVRAAGAHVAGVRDAPRALLPVIPALLCVAVSSASYEGFRSRAKKQSLGSAVPLRFVSR